MAQASDRETHTHAAAGRRCPVCEILSEPQAFSRLSVGLHRQTLLHGHAEGKRSTHNPESSRVFLCFYLNQTFVSAPVLPVSVRTQAARSVSGHLSRK